MHMPNSLPARHKKVRHPSTGQAHKCQADTQTSVRRPNARQATACQRCKQISGKHPIVRQPCKYQADTKLLVKEPNVRQTPSWVRKTPNCRADTQLPHTQISNRHPNVRQTSGYYAIMLEICCNALIFDDARICSKARFILNLS